MADTERITTDRLVIRRVAQADWRGIQSIWADQSASAYAQYDRPNDTGDEAVRARIARWAACAKSWEHVFFAVCLGDEVIGYVSLNARPGGYEIGYCFHSRHHRRGYARESLSAIIELMRGRGVTKLIAGTALNNTPSVRLLESLGFARVGTESVSFYRDQAGNDIVFEGGIFELTL